jgi:NADP-dependent 3-hydroxy acid dehydrogenase YdfG
MGRVAGKVALVAGAGGGIGAAGAEALAREGAAVFCTDRDGAAAEAAAARIRAAGGQATASALDVRDRVAVDAAVAAVVREFGRLDIVL